MPKLFEILAEVVINYSFEPFDEVTLECINYDMQDAAPGPYKIILNNAEVFDIEYFPYEDCEEVLLWKLKYL